VSENRIQVPDPELMRRAGTRMVTAMVLVLILTAPLTIGGISLAAQGELPGLPLAVGGAVLQLCCLVLVVATLRIRRTLDGRTIARSALLTAFIMGVGLLVLATGSKNLGRPKTERSPGHRDSALPIGARCGGRSAR